MKEATINTLLWILQILLAIHTGVGAVWKFSNPAANVPSLKAIPHAGWIALSVLELICCVGLVIPAINRSLGILAPIAAVCIAAEMILFCVVHLSSGATDYGPMIYWIVVAVFCAFIAYGRFVVKPL